MSKQLIVKGHTLPFEGRLVGQWHQDGGNGEGATKCRCGVPSPVLPSTAERQRWHRAHKLDVLKAAGEVPDA